MKFIFAVIYCIILFIVWVWCFYVSLCEDEDTTYKYLGIVGFGTVGVLLGVTLTFVLCVI